MVLILPSYYAAMLEWFVDSGISSAVLQDPKKLIEEEDVEVQPELVSNAVLDENVDIHLVRRFFTNDAWMQVMDVVKTKCNNPVYTCKRCSHDLDESLSIICDHCLTWFHVSCVGLKQSPKARYWFCRGCHESCQ